MLDIDMGAERIVKEYIQGDTVFDLIRNGLMAGPYIGQVREMVEQAKGQI